MTEPFILYPTGLIGDVAMNAGLPMKGASQKAPLVTPALPGVAFTALGPGQFAVDKLTGRQGAIDVWFTTGAAGSSRALVTLVNSTTGQYAEVLLDASNRISLFHRDALGNTVAQISGQLAAEGTGVRLRYRYAWDSQAVIASGNRHGYFLKNDLSVGTWAVNPTSSWDSFHPTHVYVGFVPAGVGTGSAFNGTLHKVQVGTTIPDWVPDPNTP